MSSTDPQQSQKISTADTSLLSEAQSISSSSTMESHDPSISFGGTSEASTASDLDSSSQKKTTIISPIAIVEWNDADLDVEAFPIPKDPDITRSNSPASLNLFSPITSTSTAPLPSQSTADLSITTVAGYVITAASNSVKGAVDTISHPGRGPSSIYRSSLSPTTTTTNTTQGPPISSNAAGTKDKTITSTTNTTNVQVFRGNAAESKRGFFSSSSYGLKVAVSTMMSVIHILSLPILQPLVMI